MNKYYLWAFIKKSSEEEKVGAKDLHDLMWKCRDLEIDNLWKRSALLATILVIFWTGLGYSFYKYIDLRVGGEFELESDLRNFFLLGMQIFAMLGSFISLLWICMTKGSKAWFEFFECHIDSMATDDEIDNFFTKEMAEKYREHKNGGGYFPYNGMYPKKLGRGWDNSILTPEGGPFSPSKINVVIGIVSFILFSFVELFISIVFIRLNWASWVIVIAFIVIFVYYFGNRKIYDNVGSRFLQGLMDNM